MGSDGSVDQFNGCRATRGIVLRWFLPDLDFPPFGFDVHRATIPDVPPIPFDDINTAAVAGTPSWDHAGIVTLSCATSLTFQPTAFPGWNSLVVTSNAPVRVKFSGTAWRIQLSMERAADGIEVSAVVDGVERLL